MNPCLRTTNETQLTRLTNVPAYASRIKTQTTHHKMNTDASQSNTPNAKQKLNTDAPQIEHRMRTTTESLLAHHEQRTTAHATNEPPLAHHN